ncbi:MAG: hypothetical protein KDD62_16235, partial [Bdellovibrionales bacterium]|nr:hypothetical protein [Bdellovibrionales bacterium]
SEYQRGKSLLLGASSLAGFESEYALEIFNGSQPQKLTLQVFDQSGKVLGLSGLACVNAKGTTKLKKHEKILCDLSKLESALAGSFAVSVLGTEDFPYVARLVSFTSASTPPQVSIGLSSAYSDKDFKDASNFVLDDLWERSHVLQVFNPKATSQAFQYTEIRGTDKEDKSISLVAHSSQLIDLNYAEALRVQRGFPVQLWTLDATKPALVKALSDYKRTQTQKEKKKKNLKAEVASQTRSSNEPADRIKVVILEPKLNQQVKSTFSLRCRTDKNAIGAFYSVQRKGSSGIKEVILEGQTGKACATQIKLPSGIRGYYKVLVKAVYKDGQGARSKQPFEVIAESSGEPGAGSSNDDIGSNDVGTDDLPVDLC